MFTVLFDQEINLVLIALASNVVVQMTHVESQGSTLVLCLKWRKVPSDFQIEDRFKCSMLDSMTCEAPEDEWDSSNEVECTDDNISDNKKRATAATNRNAKGRTEMDRNAKRDSSHLHIHTHTHTHTHIHTHTHTHTQSTHTHIHTHRVPPVTTHPPTHPPTHTHTHDTHTHDEATCGEARRC